MKAGEYHPLVHLCSGSFMFWRLVSFEACPTPLAHFFRGLACMRIKQFLRTDWLFFGLRTGVGSVSLHFPAVACVLEVCKERIH